MKNKKNNDYDLVFVRYKMPKMDGGIAWSSKKIKPEIPIVMISGHGDMETAIIDLVHLIIYQNLQI
jgi:DNA-binding NtrC family response regulator